MTRVDRLALEKSKFSQLTDEEQCFFVLAGHMFNEIVILERIVLHVIKEEENDTLEKARAAWFVILAKLLAGKLSEVWVALEKHYFGAAVSSADWLRSSKKVQTPLKWLKSYFNRDNFIRFVRNNYSFHYSVPDVAKQLKDYGPDDELEMLLSNTMANSLYLVSEVMVTSQLLEYYSTDDPRQAFGALMDDLLECSAKVKEFLNEFIGATCEHIASETGTSLVHLDRIDVPDSPDVDSFKLPVFINTGS